MKLSTILSLGILALGAQSQSFTYTDTKSGITFEGNKDRIGILFGLALPQTVGTDFIGQIVAPLTNGSGWGGVTLNGGMVDHLLVVAWPNGKEVVSSFRIASDYIPPPVWSGNATMKPIKAGTYVNATHLSYTFLCSKCVLGEPLTFGPTDEVGIIGYALSTTNPPVPSLASSPVPFHNAGHGQFGITMSNAKSSKFGTWAALAASNSTATPRRSDQYQHNVKYRRRAASRLPVIKRRAPTDSSLE